MSKLYLKSPMMKGPKVKRFQQFGEAVIGDEDFLVNDGWFGPKTKELAELVQTRLELPVTGIVDDDVWEAIFEYLGRNESGAQVYERDGVKVVDGRDVWKPVKKWFGGIRPWTGGGRNQIRGVLLHQTGCYMPNNPEVWRKINAHCGITRDGTVILMFPLEYLIWHGNDLTRPTIGIEIGGFFRGVEGKNNTHWPRDRTPQELNKAQVKASGVLFKILKEEFERNGGVWEVVYAHRQSHNWRMSDPGSAIWKQIAIPWIEKLGVTDGGPEFCVGSGMPIPIEWNLAYPTTFWG